jgi:hypothetical protein
MMAAHGRRPPPSAPRPLPKGAQAVVDSLVEYERLGLDHILLEFRRDDLGRMLEILDLVTGIVRPAVDRA